MIPFKLCSVTVPLNSPRGRPAEKRCAIPRVSERTIEVGLPGLDFGAQVPRQFGDDIVPVFTRQASSDRFDIAAK